MRFSLFGLVLSSAFAVAGATRADQAAGAASFAPGTYGEPFTVQALVQGCEASEEGDFCFFYAEGARWLAARGQNSNPAALDLLSGMAVNTPVIVTGDMISFGDITAESAVSKIEPGQPDQYAGVRDAMQGKWIDTTDPRQVLTVTGSEEITEYDGEYLGTAVLTFADACPDGASIGPVVVKQMMGGDPADLPCFAIIEVAPDRMELSYVGRGNTLVFGR